MSCQRLRFRRSTFENWAERSDVARAFAKDAMLRATMTAPELCISIAARPGRYGLTVHSAGYRALSLDFVYRPCKVENLPGAITGVRALDIRGASIAMPFKEDVIALLDQLDPTAREVG